MAYKNPRLLNHYQTQEQLNSIVMRHLKIVKGTCPPEEKTVARLHEDIKFLLACLRIDFTSDRCSSCKEVVETYYGNTKICENCTLISNNENNEIWQVKETECFPCKWKVYPTKRFREENDTMNYFRKLENALAEAKRRNEEVKNADL